MELGKYLSEKGMSQADFAKAVGVTRARINQIVNKRMNPSLMLAKHIEDVTKGAVTVYELIEISAPSRFKVKRTDEEIPVMGG